MLRIILCIFTLSLQGICFDVVITGYNAERWVSSNIASIAMQTYKNYHIYYINDASTDNTLTVIRDNLKKYYLEDVCTIISNPKRTHKLYNLYTTIHTYIPDNHVVIEIDADDWLLVDTVFEELALLYEKENVWMTAGGFISWPISPEYLKIKPLSSYVVKNNLFRKIYHENPIFIALRSYYAGLFKKIKKDDLIDQEGNFYKRCSDILIMIPMYEMAGDRFHIISSDWYLYNTDTGLNDYQENPHEQAYIYNIVRYKKPYKKLYKDYIWN